MPSYKDLNAADVNDKRTIEKLLVIREALKDQIPQRTHSKTLLLCTWNIRDFDKPAFGYRIKESFYYLAEIVAAFDIVAVQEVYKDLSALKKLMQVLGEHWKCVFSDTTEGSQGNMERTAFLYDSRKVSFGGLAGELVLPPLKERRAMPDGKTEIIYHPIGQVWRTPLICGFQCGWAKFMLCCVHIQWGDSKAEAAGRVREIKHVAEFLKKRTEDDSAWARKLILLGDFNIFSAEDLTYRALSERGFICPDPLVDVFTNMGKEKRRYDQILLRERENSLKITAGGTFRFFDYVFKDEEEALYHSFMVKPKKDLEAPDEFYKQYKHWRTHQMSDHLPLWVELEVDYADEYLEGKLKRV